MESEQFQVVDIDRTPFVKYGRIQAVATPQQLGSYLRKNKVSVFEKIDGGNCQIRRIGWNVVPGSKSNFLKGPIIHTRPWFERFVKWVYSNPTLFELPDNVVLFGEWMGNHTISYEDKFTDKFFMLDLLDLNDGHIFPYEQAKEFITGFGIQDINFLPILSEGRLSVRDVGGLLEKPSSYYNGPKEGLVLKDYEKSPPYFQKIYHTDFAELKKLSDGSINYLTEMRFVKNAYRLLDEQGGRELTRRELARAVVENIQYESGYSYDIAAVLDKLNGLMKKSKKLQGLEKIMGE